MRIVAMRQTNEHTNLNTLKEIFNTFVWKGLRNSVQWVNERWAFYGTVLGKFVQRFCEYLLNLVEVEVFGWCNLKRILTLNCWHFLRAIKGVMENADFNSIIFAKWYPHRAFHCRRSLFSHRSIRWSCVLNERTFTNNFIFITLEALIDAITVNLS